jgi:hypothetical protein
VRTLVTVALLLTAGLLVGRFWLSVAEAQVPAPRVSPHWEYKVTPLNETELNKLAAEGWELFATTTEFHSRPGPTGIGEIGSQPRLILKRAAR